MVVYRYIFTESYDKPSHTSSKIRNQENVSSEKSSYVHYRQKLEYLKEQWQYSYCSVFHFLEIVCHQSQTNIATSVQLSCTCRVVDETKNTQCPKWKMHNIIYRNVSFCNTSPKITPNSRVSLHWESMRILCIFNNSFLVSRKIYDLSPNNNLQAKINDRKVWLNSSILPDGS